ncbi:hypothetical protein CU098_008331, partial [Rhizopus stolonifer]
MTNNQTTPSILPIKRKRRSLTSKNPPNPQPRKKRSLLTSHNVHSSSSTSNSPPASLPTNPNLPVIPLPLFEDMPLIPQPPATIKLAKLTVNSVPPKPNTKRSILTLQPKSPCIKRSENTTFRRKRKLSGALINVDDGSDEEPTVKLFKQHETPAPVVLGVPSEAHRRKRNKTDDPPKWIKQQMNTPGENDVFFDALSDEHKDLEEPKKKEEKELALDLSQHSILPSVSNVAHVPKKQRANTSDEDDVFFDALSDQGDLFVDISSQSDNQKPDSSNEHKTTDTCVSQLTVTPSIKFSKAETLLEVGEEELVSEATKGLTPVLESQPTLEQKPVLLEDK